MPLVDVIIPIKDAEATLGSAVDSILWQSLQDISIILVDDGSKKPTQLLLENLETHSKIRVLKSPGSGIVDALNCGIMASDAPFIARMDSDDISFPERLKTQIEFLDCNPSIVMCGTGVVRFGDLYGTPKLPQHHEQCARALNLFNPFYHPTVVFKRTAVEALGRAYDPEFPIAQDFRFFSDLAQVGRVANVPKELLFYRIHSAQVTSAKRDKQNLAAFHIAVENQRRLTGKNIATGVTALPYLANTAVQLGLKHARRSSNALRNHVSALRAINE